MSTFYIASLKHTNKGHEHITFWARFHKGYTPVVGERAGRYCFGEAVSLNDGLDCIAIPADVVDSLLSPEPYFRNYRGVAARFYDQRGPVVDNTRAIWNQLIAGSLKAGRHVVKIKVEPFRGARRSFAWTEPAAAEPAAHLHATDEGTGREFFVKSGPASEIEAEKDRMNAAGHDFFTKPATAAVSA